MIAFTAWRMFITPLIWMKVNHAQEEKNTFAVCILALWNLWISHFNKYILGGCLFIRTKALVSVLKLLRRKIRPGKFTRPCIFYCKHVILDIFQRCIWIWKAILLRYCFPLLIDIFMQCKINQNQKALKYKHKTEIKSYLLDKKICSCIFLFFYNFFFFRSSSKQIYIIIM